MLISHKQLHQLLTFCRIMALEGMLLTPEGRDDLSKLLEEITDQQSDNLVEID